MLLQIFNYRNLFIGIKTSLKGWLKADEEKIFLGHFFAHTFSSAACGLAPAGNFAKPGD
jgi:hypothetical protein